MDYFFQLFKSLSVFSVVFILHLLVLGQVLQRVSPKLVWQPPKPLMVSFITLPASPGVTSSPATTMPSSTLKSEANKINQSQKHSKNIKQAQLPTANHRPPTNKTDKRSKPQINADDTDFKIKSSKRSFVPPEKPADKRSSKRSFVPVEKKPPPSAKKIIPANKADKRSEPQINADDTDYADFRIKSSKRSFVPPEKPADKRGSKRSLVPLETPPQASVKKSIPSNIEHGSNIKQNQGGQSQGGIIQKSLAPHTEAITRNDNRDSDSDKGGITTAPSFGAAYLHNPYPPYPSVSQRRGEEGKVLLRVKVTEDGRAATVQINTSSGCQRLDNSALETVSQWRFVPAQRNGKVISEWVIVPIVFKLN